MADNFIDFIVKTTEDAKLRKEFIDLMKKEKLTVDDLRNFLGKNYSLNDNDYKQLLKARENICDAINTQQKY